MRYFLEIAYHGHPFAGWQKQPGQTSVQGALEEALQTLLAHPVETTGCGRTDTGVHARQYFLHFDSDNDPSPTLLYQLNAILPPEIAAKRIFPVPDQAHARYDATHRAYEYHIALAKDPFARHLAFMYPPARQCSLEALNQAASLLLEYRDFFPFCKTGHNAQTMACDIRHAQWSFIPTDDRLVFRIASNRFLRGMVRLIVGMCLQVAQGKLPLEQVRQALDRQERLAKSWSVPPDGLYLLDIRYPDSVLGGRG